MKGYCDKNGQKRKPMGLILMTLNSTQSKPFATKRQGNVGRKLVLKRLFNFIRYEIFLQRQHSLSFHLGQSSRAFRVVHLSCSTLSIRANP